MSKLSKLMCKSLMESFPAFPKSDDPHMWEVFKTDRYLNCSAKIQRDIRYSSSLANFQLEQDNSTIWLANYFFPE